MTDDSKPLSTSDRTVEVRIRMGESGIAAAPPTTVMKTFRDTVKAHGSKPALHQKVLKQVSSTAVETPKKEVAAAASTEEDANGCGIVQDVAQVLCPADTSGTESKEIKWTTWTWDEYYASVIQFSKALISLGFEKSDTINIIGFNAPEWFFANFGAIAAGGVPAGVYTTNLPEACKYITEHSKAKVVICDGTKQLEKYLQIASELPELKAIVMYGPEAIPEGTNDKCSVPVYKFEEFLELGKDVKDEEVEKRMDAAKPGETCTLIYTSGTTGNPKAVMITNDNLTWTAKSSIAVLPRKIGNNDHMISYLPLSHIAAQMLDMHCGVNSGMQIWFAQPDALKGSLGATLKEVRPTIFFGVPRVWEKIYDKMQQVAKSTTGLKKTISTWAKSKASAKNEAIQFGSKSKSPLTYGIAHKVLSKVHEALGLDRCMACFTGAAPIEIKVLQYFASIDVPIYELFGQSECTGPHTENIPGAWKMGTCGRPLKGTESKIDAETGELCYRGRHIFAGYMDMEDKTAETIDEEGWLHSGDVAAFDDDKDPDITEGPSGFMKITGRIKELIITAGGENVPPVLIEEQFKLAMPAVANCMVIGDKRKFLTILLCLAVDVDEDGAPTDKLTGEALSTSKAIGSTATTTGEAATCEKWKKYFDDGMAAANKAAASNAQRVGKWTLLKSDFSEKAGELTPTLKLKRSVAAEIHGAEIEAMYA